MDIEEAKKQLLKHKKEIDEKFISARYSKAIEVVLSELDKEDKIINLMAEELADWYMDNRVDDRKIDKQYVINKFANFANKVEEEK